MKLAVIGASGKAGYLIAEEALSRGHQVTAIVRRPDSRIPQGAELLVKDLFDLSSNDLKDFDAVVSAFGTGRAPEEAARHIDAANHLIDIFKAIPQVRLLMMGGASSLYKDESKEHILLEDFPTQFSSIPENQKKALDILRGSDINWTFFSPAAHFDATGSRTGKYELGGDVKILNKIGLSYISYADYAVAMVDEIENNKHPRQRFTAVSCDPYFRNAPQYFPIEKSFFTRAGAWMSLSVDNVKYGAGALHLTTSRSMRVHGRIPDGIKLFRIYPTYNGKRMPFATQVSSNELTLHTLHGDVRFTWADSSKLMAEGDEGMGLLWTRQTEAYELVKPRKNGAWESALRSAYPLCFKGLEGSEFRFDDTWDWYELNCGTLMGRTYPCPDGKFCMVCEEFDYAVKVRDSYPSYAEAKADMQADWEKFLAAMPHFIEPYESKREDTAYFLWHHLVGPTKLTPTWMMLMFPGEIVSQWQLVQNGVVMQEIPELSKDLLLAPLYRQGDDGQLADGYDEAYVSTGSYKPPVYGWALKNVMAHHDLSKEWSREDLEMLYKGAGKWADWIMEYRDDDGDGLPGFEGGNENGFDEVTAFWDQLSMATPDLCAQEVLNFEAQGDLAKLLGKPQEEIDSWYAKANGLLERMIDKMWDGEHFVALKNYTHEPVFSGSNMHYIPMVLGSRLPQHIIDKMTADLMVEGKLLSPYGLASENMDSDVFEVTGVKMGCGPICPPGQLFILSGMWEAGKKAEAKMIIDRYLNRLMNGGFSHFIDPVNGDGSVFWGTWCRVVFMVLARMVSEG